MSTESDLELLLDKADKKFVSIKKRKNSKPIYQKALDLAIKQSKKIEIHYIKGKIALIDEDPKKALKHLNHIKNKKFNLFLKAMNYKGVAFDILGEYDKAIECYEIVLKNDPEFALTWNNKGIAFDNLGNHGEYPICHKKAIECFNKVIKLDKPIDDLTASAWNNKGISFDHLGNYKKAIDCYNKSLDHNSNYHKAWNYKGIAFCSLGKHNEAIRCYDEGLKIDPTYKWFKINKGRAYHLKGEYSEAIHCFDEILNSDPDDEDAKLNKILSTIYLGTLDKNEIEELYDQILKDFEIITNKKIRDEKVLELKAHKAVVLKLKDEYKSILNKKDDCQKDLDKYLSPRQNPIEDNFLMILRRWNSWTPAIITDTKSNMGGGYFLFWKGKGIVIDPGFDFLYNFLHKEKLRIYDINAVIITHSHIDHCADFEALLTLIYEYNDALEHQKNFMDTIEDKIEHENEELKIEEFNKGLDAKKKKIDIFLNLGAMKKFLGWIPVDEKDKNAKIRRIYPLEQGITYDLEDYSLKLKIKKATHKEILAETYSTGLIIELYGRAGYNKRKPFRIGFTSDTKYVDEIVAQYRNVDMLVPHLGSIDENDFNPLSQKKDSNHLKLKGVISAISKSQPKLAVISEFGEELGNSRVDLVSALSRAFENTTCLTGDIGLKIKIPELSIKCQGCKKFVNKNKIIEGIDNSSKDSKSIVYYCPDCVES